MSADVTPALLVVGEALVDVVEDADGRRSEHPGGSPVNVAVAASRLGTSSVLATQLGDDEQGMLVRRHLEASGVRVKSMPPSHVTGTATARLGADGAATYDFDLSWDPERLPAPEGFVAVHAGSIGLSLQPGSGGVVDWLARARAAGVAVSIDPNIRPTITPDLGAVRATIGQAIASSWVVKLSDEDAEQLMPGRSFEAAVDEVLGAGASVVAMTRGGADALLGCGDVRVEVPTPRTNVVDTIGAGDTFMGALLAACARWGWLGRADLGADELTALGEVAVAAASITCSRAGADPPWAEELGSFGGTA